MSNTREFISHSCCSTFWITMRYSTFFNCWCAQSASDWLNYASHSYSIEQFCLMTSCRQTSRCVFVWFCVCVCGWHVQLCLILLATATNPLFNLMLEKWKSRPVLPFPVNLKPKVIIVAAWQRCCNFPPKGARKTADGGEDEEDRWTHVFWGELRDATWHMAG